MCRYHGNKNQYKLASKIGFVFFNVWEQPVVNVLPLKSLCQNITAFPAIDHVNFD